MTRHGLWLPPLAILLGVLAVLGYSAIDPVADRLTWLHSLLSQHVAALAPGQWTEKWSTTPA